MVNWLMPFAILPKTYTFFFFDLFSQIAVVVFGLFILVKLYLQPKQLEDVLPKTSTLRIWGVFVVVQLILMTYESFVVGATTRVYGLLHGLLMFIQVILSIWMAYTIQKMLIRSYDDAIKFMKSVVITMVVYLGVIVLPQILYLFGFTSLTHWINPIAHLFERHWENRNFYDNGSYVTTSMRVNGFEPEAAYLALLVGIAFSPFLLMLIQEPLRAFKNRWIYWIAIILGAASLGVLLLAKTTTGFLLIGILALVYWLAAPKKQKISLFFLGIIAVIGVALIYITVPSVHNLLNTWIFQKGGTDNRLGGTIALIRTWLQHPLFGVGYGYEGQYIVDNLPAWSKNNFEYMQVYQYQAYPILNDTFGWLARYGLVFFLIFIWLLFGLVKRSLVVLKELSGKFDQRSMFYRVSIKAFYMTIITVAVVSSVTPSNVVSWPILLMLFFYWRVIHIAENDVFAKESE
ncbi:O-antigen ligase family protein [Weissella paramesenteroides]|uniref:O-antigen ligase family protein n=1 Tax=Weissella paramesenteroides TaxID=1249 RepID=UPI003857A6EF